MLFLYTIVIRAYGMLLRLAAPFSVKAKQWVDGRKKWEAKLRSVSPKEGFDLWMHCSSLGEFEQGRPVLEAYRTKYPQASILLSFFSPSGYEIRKNYPIANTVQYLPLDTPSNAHSWLSISRPKKIIFVKYDFWFNFLNAIEKYSYSCYLISANFPKDHFFTSSPGRFFIKYLNAFSIIFFQQPPQFKIPRGIETKVNGDTRVDRVIQIQSEVSERQSLVNWIENKKVFIWGSVWTEDYELIQAALKGPLQSWKHIIAPHDPSNSSVKALMSITPDNSQLFSKPYSRSNSVIVVDGIGHLASLYRYGSAAYIGGGFGKGIHNTLEPMAAGCPVIFGPKHQKFPEAIESLDKKCGFVVKNVSAFIDVVSRFNEAEFLQQTQVSCKQYIDNKKGATKEIMEHLRPADHSIANY